MITAFYEVLFNALIAFVIIIAEVLIFQIPVSATTFLFIPAVFVLIIMGMCFGLLILPLSVLYKDVQFALPTFLQLAMYLTPVVYATPVFSGATKILAYNPVSPILTYGRDCLMGVTSSVDLGVVGLVSLASVIILIIGLVIQRIGHQRSIAFAVIWISHERADIDTAISTNQKITRSDPECVSVDALVVIDRKCQIACRI